MQSIIGVLSHHSLITVFLALFLESVGLPLPAYPLLIAAAARMAAVESSLLELLLVGMTANLVPDIGWYAAGRRYGTRIMGLLCRISITPDSCARNSSDLFIRLGPASLIFIKFIPGVGNLGIVLAGATKIRLSVFSVFDIIGGLLYIGAGLALGFVFHNQIDALLHTLASFGRTAVIAIAAALALYLLMKYAQRKWLLRRLRMDRVTVDQLAAMLNGQDRPVVLDVRPAIQREKYGMIPGAIFADPQKLDVVIENGGAGREIVVYCACPNEVSAATLAHKLRKNGFKKIRPLLGGIDEWIRAGKPVEQVSMIA